jgi:hypothetical protein
MTPGSENPNSQPEAPAEPRKKRRYTVTEKVLEANRRNLKKATAVPREIRFRSTEKRRAANRASQPKAVAARKRDRSPGYAPCFRFGFGVVDLERSLPLVGATSEQYQRHLALYQAGLAPCGPGEEKLVRALGMTSWRWLGGVRLYGDSEELGVWRLFEEREKERAAGPPLSWKRLLELRWELEEVFGGWGDMSRPEARVRHRGQALCRQLSRERGEQEPESHHLFSMRRFAPVDRGARSSRVVQNFELYPAEVLSNPLVSPGRVLAALGEEPAAPPEREASPESEASSPPQETSPSAQEERRQGKRPRSAAQPRLRRQVREARQAGRALPGCFDDFLRLVQAALADGHHPRTLSATDAPEEGSAASGAGDFWVREVVEALWERRGIFRRQADRLEQELTGKLEAFARPPAAGPPRPLPGYVAEDELMYQFDLAWVRALRAQEAANERVRAALYGLLVARYGKRPEFEGLKKNATPSRWHRIWAEGQEAEYPDTAGQYSKAVELLAKAAELEGGPVGQPESRAGPAEGSRQ